MSKTAVIYSNGNQECERMAALLESLPDVSNFHKYTVGKDFEQYQFEMEFGGNATYPQIAIDTKHIGSMKDALSYMNLHGMFQSNNAFSRMHTSISELEKTAPDYGVGK